ncbi:hypothetical protein [Alkalilacustris brevis]|uniref:hypothetical protein n=1 Tax=Alkalilacustris brevis TaxID=2026338 RepID=UPI0012D2EC4A|nr:hypothetical protein [Alkalilacustris brevis]
MTAFDILAQQLTRIDFRGIEDIWVEAGVGISSQEAVRRIPDLRGWRRVAP